MITPVRDLLVNNKTFRFVFGLGVLSSLANIILTIIYSVNGDVCADMGYCDYSSDFYNTCIEGSSLYCCSSYKSSTSSCGYYYNSCYFVGYGYQDCTGLWIGRYITGGISLVSLVALAVLAHRHKNRMNAFHMGNYMRQN